MKKLPSAYDFAKLEEAIAFYTRTVAEVTKTATGACTTNSCGSNGNCMSASTGNMIRLPCEGRSFYGENGQAG